jgi:hypothetical protein
VPVPTHTPAPLPFSRDLKTRLSRLASFSPAQGASDAGASTSPPPGDRTEKRPPRTRLAPGHRESRRGRGGWNRPRGEPRFCQASSGRGGVRAQTVLPIRKHVGWGGGPGRLLPESPEKSLMEGTVQGGRPSGSERTQETDGAQCLMTHASGFPAAGVKRPHGSFRSPPLASALSEACVRSPLYSETTLSRKATSRSGPAAFAPGPEATLRRPFGGTGGCGDCGCGSGGSGTEPRLFASGRGCPDVPAPSRAPPTRGRLPAPGMAASPEEPSMHNHQSGAISAGPCRPECLRGLAREKAGSSTKLSSPAGTRRSARAVAKA